jgi:CBS domain-containing protein
MAQKMMAQKIREIMTERPVTMEVTASATDAARAMQQNEIGDVIVVQDGRIHGLVTDRDLVVRVIAEGRDAGSTRLGDVCSPNPACLSPDDDISSAVQLVRERAVRRIPIVQGEQPVGVLSIGDLAIAQDSHSALADISAAAPNN